MENQFKETYNKISIDDDRRSEMETAIRKTKSSNIFKTGSALAIAAATIVVLMAVPVTRTRIVKAAAMLIKVFTANGQEITVDHRPEESVVSIDYDENKDYTLVENGRLYLVVGDEKIDVTDKCSSTEYYRYESVNKDGSKNVIFVGGTTDNPGWVELIFDASGKYVTNHMSIKEDGTRMDDPKAWYNACMHNEGVPCGIPELDSALGY